MSNIGPARDPAAAAFLAMHRAECRAMLDTIQSERAQRRMKRTEARRAHEERVREEAHRLGKEAQERADRIVKKRRNFEALMRLTDQQREDYHLFRRHRFTCEEALQKVLQQARSRA